MTATVLATNTSWGTKVRPTMRGTLAAVAAAIAIEAVARSTRIIPEPRLPCLVAVVYAAFTGGLSPSIAAIVCTIAYTLYFYSASGPLPQRGGEIVVRLLVYAVTSGAIAGLIVALRLRESRASRRALSTEQDRSADALREKTELADRHEVLYQGVIDSLPAHIAVLDPRGRIIATNRSWDRFADANGSTVAAVGVGSDYLRVCGVEGAPVADGIRAVLDDRLKTYSTEYPCDSLTEKRWFLLTVSPLTRGYGVVVSHLDITARRRAEEAVLQRAAELDALARSLKQTNQELDQFAYITSHDLRAPLRGIANLSSWIEEDMGDKFTAEGHKQMELLRGRVHRMEAMIDGILEYSRVGRVKAQHRTIDVSEVIAEAIDLLDPPSHITIAIAPGMPRMIGDRLALQQVFMNLIGNAIKYNDKSEGRVSIACRDVGAAYEFSVADNGPGIERQYHEKIFVIFQTLQPRDKVEGTGVGLSLVKKIVEHAGGCVTIESEPGKGATFRFTWPKSMSTKNELDQPAAPRQASAAEADAMFADTPAPNKG